MGDFVGYVLGDLKAHLGATLFKAFWPTPSTAVAIVVCTSLVYLFLVFFLQFSRRSVLGHTSIVDLVLMLVLANAVQNAMVAGDATLGGGLLAALTLFAWDGSLGYLRRHLPQLRPYIGGERIALMRDGQVLRDRLVRENLDEADLVLAARQQGLSDLTGVCEIFLELDGSLTLVPASDTPLPPRSQLRR